MLELDHVTKRFATGGLGLDSVDLAVREGEFLTLLGPSGCGKTTTLRVIAGFETPTSGEVRLDGRDIAPLGPHLRPVNTVFQDYALFPHMDVAANVGFGLSVRSMPRAAIRKAVAEALAMVGLSDKIDSPVQALSGGQRQRVALARAIVCQPRLLLLDEPLSALDAHLREHMQVELKRLQRELGTTFVMVTHDQAEALSISDRIVVMNKAKIEQVDTPARIYDQPATRFVAGFIGAMNLVAARPLGQDSGRPRFAVSDWIVAPEILSTPAAAQSGVILAIRPEDIRLSPEPVEGATAADIEGVVFFGKSLRLHLALAAGVRLIADVARLDAHGWLVPGARGFASLRPGAICPVYPA